MSDEKIGKLHATVHRASGKIVDLLIGKKATILSDYNGQPFGGSRPSMQGRVIEIADVTVTEDDILVLPFCRNVYLPLCEVRIHWKPE